ncbi:MAG: hypothetical protein JWM11_2991, partial [Planctomycetaceae bacterium]|nr:hypothetical protein [Planctomycetaceae bacterium]
MSGVFAADFLLCLPLLVFVYGFTLGILRAGLYLAILSLMCEFFL